MDGVKTEATLFLPVGIGINWWRDRRPREEALPILQELAAVSNKVFLSALPEWMLLDGFAAEVVSSQAVQKWFRGNAGFRAQRPYTLRVSVNVTCDPAAFSNRFPDEEEAAAAGMASSCVPWVLERTASDLVLVACLAHPALVSPGRSVVVHETTREHLNAAGVDEAVARASEKGWPPIHRLDADKVWAWLDALDGYRSGFGKGPVGRAVGALSHIVLADRMTSMYADLLWSLLGLEALYGRGTTGLQAQILEKSEVLLGPRQAHQKAFKQIYAFRSRFVHGDVDVPLAHGADDEEHAIDVEGNSGLATAILVASLQRLIIEGKHALEFRLERVT